MGELHSQTLTLTLIALGSESLVVNSITTRGCQVDSTSFKESWAGPKRKREPLWEGLTGVLSLRADPWQAPGRGLVVGLQGV